MRDPGEAETDGPPRTPSFSFCHEDTRRFWASAARKRSATRTCLHWCSDLKLLQEDHEQKHCYRTLGRRKRDNVGRTDGRREEAAAAKGFATKRKRWEDKTSELVNRKARSSVTS